MAIEKKIAQDIPTSEWLEIIQKAIEKAKKKKEKKYERRSAIEN